MANSSLIRWGILGTGAIASEFATALKLLPKCSLKAVASRSLANAEAFVQSHGVTTAYGSYEDLVNQAPVDVVYIATPHSRHHIDCLLALNADKAVLCEKPFAINTRLAQEVLDVAAARQLFCMEAMWMRFIPLMQQVRQIVQDGELGEIRQLTANFGVPMPVDPKGRMYNIELGGGSLLDLGVYTISFADFLLGKPSHIQGLATIGQTGVDEQASMLLQYDNGAQASLSSSFQTQGTNNAVIMGTHGQLTIHTPLYYPEKLSLIRFPDTTQLKAQPRSIAHPSTKDRLKSKLRQNPFYKRLRLFKPSSLETIVKVEPGNGYHHEAAEVVRCLQSNQQESPSMPWQDTLNVMTVMDELRRSWNLVYPQD